MTTAGFLAYLATGAAAWMFRGGAFWPSGSTQLARAACALVLATPLAGWTADPWLLALVPALWAGLASAGWGDFFDMGRGGATSRSEELVSPLLSWMDPRSIAHDVLGMSLTGLVILAPAAALLWWLGLAWWVVLIPGALLGPLYWLAWRLSEARAIGIAEGMAGAAIAAGLAMAVTL